jgi:hypothetical protein
MVIALIVVEGLTPPTTLLCGYTTVTRARVVSTTRLAYRYLGDDDSRNYLESLNSHSPLPSSFDDEGDAPSSPVGVGIGGVETNNNYEEDEVKFRTLQTQRDTIISSQRESMLQDVRNQKSIYIEKLNINMQGAMLRASKRTYPNDVLSKRITEGQLERNGREKERLEMRYVEKLAMLESSKMQRHNDDEADSNNDDEQLASSNTKHHRRRVGIPILDILSRPPIINLPPLLVGETVLIHHTELTPFQLRALDVASSHHHVSSTDSSWCSAPLVAVIDSYTATTELPVSSVASSSLRYRRYATLASVEIINKGDDEYGSSTSSMVKLMGVGRAFLRNYFSSSGAMIPMTEEEGELSDILVRIQELGNTSLDDDDNDDDDDDDQELTEEDEYEVNKEKLPVIMAEFDVFLDDSSIIYNDEQFTSQHHHQSASSRHAITNLFRAANRVYRAFDERKRLVAGLRAGASRLRHSQSDNALYYNDSARNALEQMEYYGLCSTTNGMMSTIHELTYELMLQLRPYYSQEHREREEYEAEVTSMAVLKTLEVTPTELAALLLTPSATRRLELEFDIIMRHKEKLRQLVRIINEELMDCGEECTDLW